MRSFLKSTQLLKLHYISDQFLQSNFADPAPFKPFASLPSKPNCLPDDFAVAKPLRLRLSIILQDRLIVLAKTFIKIRQASD
jgi:hypothetical protein